MSSDILSSSRRRRRRATPEHTVAVKPPMFQGLFKNLLFVLLCAGSLYGLLAEVRNSELQREVDALKVANEKLLATQGGSVNQKK